LDIPANNCAILQSGNDLELLPAGQHCITHPNVTLRGLYTLGENQFEMPTKDMCVILVASRSSETINCELASRADLLAIKFP